MNRKYVILGFNIVIASLIFTIIGFIINNYMVAGIGFSLVVYGFVILMLGVTITSPLEEILSSYTSITINHYNRLLEDLGLNQKHVIYTCPSRGLIAISEEYLDCGKLMVGIGAVGGKPYLTLYSRKNSTETGEIDLRVKLQSLGLSRGITVESGRGKLRIVLEGITPSIHKYIKGPLNPLRLTILQTLLESIDKVFLVTHEELSNEKYVIEGRIIEKTR